jgi:alpha-amylase
VVKRFHLSPDRASITSSYQITYRGKKKYRTNFGIEFNINLLAGDAPDRYFHIPGVPLEDRKLASFGECRDISEIHLIDEWAGIKVVLKSGRRGDLWRFPIYTVSLSESGFEKIFQGSCLVLFWPLQLNPGVVFDVDLELGITPFQK